ncbi:MAG: helix-hairpin-helix domain-containing protein, partial [Synergistaceae bacterium]|nr:helix-hairpin-helix domain-containing protein [Synergistaceae bacterium]
MNEASNAAIDMAGAISKETGAPLRGVRAVLSLLDDGGTVPFIARYRKELTGGLDEVAISDIRDVREKLAELGKRRAAIMASCEEQGVLTESLRKSLAEAATMAELEDTYLPYRPRRRTRATAAKERGLEPLAVHIMKQVRSGPPLRETAAKYVSPEAGIETADDAIAGARDIIAESVSQHAGVRGRLRQMYARKAVIYASRPAKAPDGDSGKYRDYYDTETGVHNAPSHRILALLRGEREGCLRLRMEPDEGAAIGMLRVMFIKGDGEQSAELDAALRDSYKRLLAPSMETELRASLKERADGEAIRVFAGNLRSLLMASPYGGHRIIAVDPGFKSGCKLAVLNEHGGLLRHETIYPHPPQRRADEAASAISRLASGYGVSAIAVGNGTAGRETDAWLRSLGLPLHVVMVSESGASVYSASDVARGEFPDLDLTVRGAVSIGRRFQDPLAELVKIDPKSIGVGQYQHDVDQKKLKRALDDAVTSCVNRVGVDANSASRELLAYVSGLNPSLAANFVKYRDDNGAFRSREDFRKVPRLGPKAFEQAAGFLGIRGGSDPL